MGKTLAEVTEKAVDGMPVFISLTNPKLWSPAEPFLYDLCFQVLDSDGQIVDEVKSYTGMRKIGWEDGHFCLNNKPIYLRLVLDQGFYPEGIWTAPSDKDLKRDIELSMAAGFNGARLHQKVFEERFHYWADTLGYLTWGESASWGLHVTELVSARNILSEWKEIIERDRNHPSIIAWTPLNETRFIEPNPHQQRRLTADLYDLSKALDLTRPVNDASGYIHVKTDLWTVHHYTQSGKELSQILDPNRDEGIFRNYPEWEPPYEHQPYLVDEYGGILWIPEDRFKYMDTSWGYGKRPESIEEFYKRLKELTMAILSQKHICGYCYTQLTDVEQEQNGIYNFDRSEKFDMSQIRNIFAMVPGICSK
jgi:beta-galactosidase/beta-glucuronidase